MASNSQKASNSATSGSGKNSSEKSQDAIALLTADHKAVKALFKKFDELVDQEDADEQKADLVEQICNELTVHTQIEEEIFYPALREAIDDDALMDEADVEHASAKDLIGQLESMSPGDDHYDAKVVVLGEYVNHHVEEEEGEMFEKARKADVDTAALGAELAERKAELKSEMGLDEDADESAAPPKRSSEAAKGGNGGKKPASRSGR
jgi:hemerythrin-like domain-containing protein